MAVFYGTVQRRLSIDRCIFQVGVDVGGLEFYDDGTQTSMKVFADVITVSFMSFTPCFS